MRYLLIVLTFLTILGAEERSLSIYDLNVVTIDGEEISMSKYKGKVLLIVNVASECGFTPQYKGLEELYQNYKERDFVVLGFPSNQFSNQEPGSNKEIKAFCKGSYNVTFDMFAKVDVNGENTIPLYKFLKEKRKGFLWTKDIKWNFTKFLIDRNGNIVERFAPMTQPHKMTASIEKIL
jgi:glutathione peroxidase